MSKVIAFSSIKGGVGKTTLAAQFVAFLSSNAKVGVLDLDPQGSLVKWGIRRLEKAVANVGNVVLLPVDFDLENNVENYDYIICDLAGVDSKISRLILAKYADALVSPFKTSQIDIDTVIKHNQLYVESKKFNSRLELFYLFNECDTHPKNKELEESIGIFNHLISNQHIAANLLEHSPVYKRNILRTAFSDGLSCFDLGYKASKSKQEIEKVILSILDK